MNRKIVKIGLLLLSSLFISFALYAKNELHPSIKVLDKSGRRTNSIENISPEKSCAPCHDVAYINSHNIHFNGKVKANCVVCHLKGDLKKIKVSKIHKSINLPGDENCLTCHGAGSTCQKSFRMPSDFLDLLGIGKDGRNYGLTQKTGEILSPVNISNSLLNIKGRSDMSNPWDVHSRRSLACISCHFTKNDPRNCALTKSDLNYLKRDPRKIKAPSDYLKWPDHNLRNATCECCHNANLIHGFLPAKERHLESLDCRSCHISKISGPGFKTIDETVVTLKGSPRVELRGDSSVDPDTKINARYLKGYKPFLLTEKKEGKNKIAPYNLITEWYWVSGKDSKKVSSSIIKKAFLKKGKYRKDIIKIFDADKNGIIDLKELTLNSKEKVKLIKSKLKKLSVKEPSIKSKVLAHKIIHGVTSKKIANKDCNICHGEGARLGGDVRLTDFSPYGVLPVVKNMAGVIINGDPYRNESGKIILRRDRKTEGRYVFGFNRSFLLDIGGLILFIGALGGLFVHGFLRYLGYKKHPANHVKTKIVYMYSAYERIWHWTMALGVIILLITGLEIHFPEIISIFGFDSVTAIHNGAGLVLLINAGLSLFYHLATGEITQYFRVNGLFVKETIVQIYYYGYSIFKSRPHPMSKTVNRKLNPLQQLTYVGLLNVLLPFQVITGLLIWVAGKSPQSFIGLGGLNYIGPLHYIGSWLFIVFIIVHVYLTTTGHTVFANIKAMVTGYDEIDEEEHGEMKSLVKLSVPELFKKIIGDIKKDQAESKGEKK